MDLLTKSNTSNIKYFIYSFTAAWILLWFHLVFKIYDHNKDYYRFAIRASPDEIQEYHTKLVDGFDDFYQIIKYCEREVPRDQQLQIILPADDPVKYVFFRDKARYFLYPRNYGDNSTAKEYILVYQKDDYTIPQGYVVLRSFGNNKYLLKKQNPL